MKEFFTWYLIASIIGVWSILAYGFYRMSKMAASISALQKIVMDLSISRLTMLANIAWLKKESICEKGSSND